MAERQSFKYISNIIIAPPEITDDTFKKDGTIDEFGTRRWLGDLDWDKYVKGTQEALFEIMKYNWTGLAIMNAIAKRRDELDLVIQPSDPNICNAHAKPFNRVLKNGRKEFFVEFTPYVWGDDNKCARQNPGDFPGGLPDEVLLHELIHAYRRIHGRSQTARDIIIPDFYYETYDEFVAILLANIYRSAKGRHNLRKDHLKWRPLPIWLHDNEQFLSLISKHEALIRYLAHEEAKTGLLRDVRHDTGRFNPVRYWFDHFQFRPVLVPPAPPSLLGPKVKNGQSPGKPAKPAKPRGRPAAK
jgi:hypothetical protein